MSNQQTTLTLAGALRGVRLVLPILPFVTIFGFGFGAAATEAGLSVALSTWISTANFAGASQFAGLAFWIAPIPVLALCMTVFAVNARHLLYGAALYPWTKDLPFFKRMAVSLTVSDPNFVVGMSEYGKGERDTGIIVGAGLSMWVVWIAGTFGGAYAGALFEDPDKYALDALMVLFFSAMMRGYVHGRIPVAEWAVAAVTSVAALYVLPENWHIIAGGIAGGLAGAFLYRKPEEEGAAE